jgi:hypothetical protein
VPIIKPLICLRDFLSLSFAFFFLVFCCLGGDSLCNRYIHYHSCIGVDACRFQLGYIELLLTLVYNGFVFHRACM